MPIMTSATSSIALTGSPNVDETLVEMRECADAPDRDAAHQKADSLLISLLFWYATGHPEAKKLLPVLSEWEIATGRRTRLTDADLHRLMENK